MIFNYFSKNGTILPIKQASIPLASIEYAYGFGAYETIRVLNGKPYFLANHIERLFTSARLIELDHPYTDSFVEKAITDLVSLLGESITCNLKVLLIGAPTKDGAQLYILPLAPLFPDKKLYRDGVKAITAQYERLFPQAKTLNMLASYLHYRKAKRAGCYDALLTDHSGRILEGTRTNFFGISGYTLITAPDETVLAGVTRKAVLHTARANHFTIEFKALTLAEIQKLDGAFMTGTSIGILPIKTINEFSFPNISSELRMLMTRYDDFKKECRGIFPEKTYANT